MIEDKNKMKDTDKVHTEELVLLLLCSDCWEHLKEKGVSIPPRGYEYAITSNSSKCGNEEHLKVKGVKDTDKVYRVKLTSISPHYSAPQLEQKMLLRVPKGVEINSEILTNSGYFDDYWEYGVIEGATYPNINWEKTETEISFCEVEVRRTLMDAAFVVDSGTTVYLCAEIIPTLDKNGEIYD